MQGLGPALHGRLVSCQRLLNLTAWHLEKKEEFGALVVQEAIKVAPTSSLRLQTTH